MMKHEQPLPQARKQDLVTREVADELLVYDLKTHQAHCLNQAAALVWKYCDGQKGVTEIVRAIQQEQAQPIDEAVVWLAIKQLSKANLLNARITPPAAAPRLTRRETVKQLGLGFALALPMVMSIVAPAAAAAASGCVVGCRRSNQNETGSAANCGGCATLSGTCFNNQNCSSNANNTTTTCAQCAGGSWTL